MEFVAKLAKTAAANNSLVCVGLDSNVAKLPAHLSGTDRMFEFNKAIIDATKDLVCVYKPNSAFYEAEGPAGIQQLKKTVDYIHETTDIPVILDAKRADIGSTNEGYVKFIFNYLGVDAVTVQPYMGSEALGPFLAQKDRGIIVLCRTSNAGAAEIQDLESGGKKVWQIVAEKVRDEWNTNGNCQLVVGATYPEEMAEIRKLVGDDMWFLVPGAGSQGGDVEATVKAGVNSKGEGIMVNSSRDIIFASSGEDFAEAARAKTMELRNEINKARKAVV